MAGGVALPQVLQLLDGTPHKKVISAVFENLPLAKMLQVGDISGMMKQVLAAGTLSPILANPAGALTQELQGIADQAAATLQSALGSGARDLVSALTGASGLTSALSSLQAAGDNLVGLTNSQAGLFSLAGHDSLLSMLGSAAPAAMAAQVVLGPVQSGDLLNSLSAAVPNMVNAVIAGRQSISDATNWVNAQTTALGSIVSASANALAMGQAIQMQASAVATVAGLVSNPPMLAASAIQQAMSTFVTPSAQAAIRQALSDSISAIPHAPIDVAAMTSLGPS